MSQVSYPPLDPEALQARITAVKADELMAEAGRKILLAEFTRMLKNEAGSHAGEDPAYVHHMRVATRRMRSAFRIMELYFKSKPTDPFVQHLRNLAEVLGSVRDLDVMIGDLQAAQSDEDEETRAGIQVLIDRLKRKHLRAHKKLVAHLDSSAHRQFKETFAAFLTQAGKGIRSLGKNGVVPQQVRHILPVVLHDHLANVRAYDMVLNPIPVPADSAAQDGESASSVDANVLHDLRIEFKRLRYAISFFQDVLGQSGEKFVNELKTIQDHLGRLNDLVVAQAQLHTLLNAAGLDEALLRPMLEKMAAEQVTLENGFPAVWAKFNTRTVQSYLSNALLALH